MCMAMEYLDQYFLFLNVDELPKLKKQKKRKITCDTTLYEK